MEKDLSRIKLPHIRPTLRQTSLLASSDEKRLGNVDFDVQNLKNSNQSSTHERPIHWKSAQFSLDIDVRRDNRSFGRRRRSTLESSLKRNGTSDHDQTFQSERTFTLPLRKHNSEPSLQQDNNPFTVKAKSLKLNYRVKEKTNNEKKLFDDLLPSVFFDTNIAHKEDEQRGNISKDKKKKIKSKVFEENKRNMAKERSCSQTQAFKEPIYSNKYRQKVKESVIDQDVDKIPRKPRKVLPKRRLSEQIDAYEVNRGEDRAFPRRITIRTSKSCPTIVIHECGESDETTDETCCADNGNAGNDSKEMVSVHVQMNGCQSLNNDTTSFVSCWRPRESIANKK